MGDIVAFDGKFRRTKAQLARPQVQENQWYAPRIAKAFFGLRHSVERIAKREGITRLEVQRVIREASIPVPPMGRVA